MSFAAVLSMVVATQTPDTAIIAAVRAVVEREPIEVFGAERGKVQVRGVELMDVDGDGKPEAFVWISPKFRQTPTILVYTYTAPTGARRLTESLAPGSLQPISGRLRDPHTLGVAVDMTIGSGKDDVDTLSFLSNAATNGMSVVWYRTFLHADMRDGFVTFADLTDRSLPASDTKTCESFEFSEVDGLVSGHLAGDALSRYLVALTTSGITIYRFKGIGPQGRLAKQSWTRDRPATASALIRAASGRIMLQMRDGRTEELQAP